MDGSGAYFTSRTELLEWLNNVLPEPAANQLQLKKIEKCGSGIPYAILLAEIYPNMRNIISRRLKGASAGILSMIATGNPNDAGFGIQGNISEYDSHHNMKLVQDILTKNHVARNVEVDRIAKGHFQSNLEFLQWFKKFSSDYGVQVQHLQQQHLQGGTPGRHPHDNNTGLNDNLDLSVHASSTHGAGAFLDDHPSSHFQTNVSPRESSHGNSTTRSNLTNSASIAPLTTTSRNPRDAPLKHTTESAGGGVVRSSSNSKQKVALAGGSSPAPTTGRGPRAVSPRSDIANRQPMPRTASQQAISGSRGAAQQRSSSGRRKDIVGAQTSHLDANNLVNDMHMQDELNVSGVSGGSSARAMTTGFRQSGGNTATSTTNPNKHSPFIRTARPTTLTSSPQQTSATTSASTQALSPRTRSALTPAELRQIRNGHVSQPSSQTPTKSSNTGEKVSNANSIKSSSPRHGTGTPSGVNTPNSGELDFTALSEPTLQHLLHQSQNQLKQAESDRDFFYDKLRMLETLVNKETAALSASNATGQQQHQSQQQHQHYQEATLLLLENIREILMSADNEI